MNLNEIRQQLDKKDFDQIFRFWDRLSLNEQSSLLNQIKLFDWEILKRQKLLISSSETLHQGTFEPFVDFVNSGNNIDWNEGQTRICQGQLGCLLLAGGQGTRLGSSDPKGMYPTSLINKKSLFQICSEKVLAASKQAGIPLSFAIMTSPINSEATINYFKKNHFFGLDEDQISFFTQGMLPFLNDNGALFLEEKNKISTGPNGNGLCLREFVDAGIWTKWKKKGIRYVNMILIDNPLADPFDPELLGFHIRQNVDITSKSAEKKSPEEKVGLLVKQNGLYRVIEYSEMPDKEKNAVDPSGNLLHRCANLSLFCFTMDFIDKVASKKDLPLHSAWKCAKIINDQGLSLMPTEPNAWKFETYIFDVFQYTNRIAALLYPRAQCFAPLKNGTGDNSLETVQKAIQEREKVIIKSLTGKEPPPIPFELAADFYYPTEEMRHFWKGKSINGGYIAAL
ncbi:MAG: UDPGP type 1 family protein [Parachlamydiaceae bacterium]|nr:UDPGP type 1 family protein [Parachlamydiaceae bacterium]